MIMCKGRLASLSVLFRKYKEETITILLAKERITIFSDGTIKRYKIENFIPKNKEFK